MEIASNINSFEKHAVELWENCPESVLLPLILVREDAGVKAYHVERNQYAYCMHACPIPLQDVQWTFECPLDISVRPLDEWTSECPLDISVCPMDEWTFECRMDISVRPLVEWTYECPMDISVRPMVEWTFVYVQWTLLIFNTKYDNAGNAFCLLKAIMN